jgi:RNA polymerase sigma factor (sigma-70 family)
MTPATLSTDQLSQGEKFLLEQIRRGEADAWSQLMDRFQGRLVAFARSRSISDADAEDLVQETFVKFLHGLASYRGEASLETYLFMILRRRIIDHLRGRKVAACIAQEGDEDQSSGHSTGIQIAAPDLTASAYARRDEQLERERSALAGAIGEMIDALKEEKDFRDLKIMEALFYAQVRNKDIAKLLGMDEKAIALIKHRWLKSLRERVERRLGEGADATGLEEDEGGATGSLLTEIWEEGRLSCPKRSTVGGFLLGTLDAAWKDYVRFHIEKLGCRFCRANMEDLKNETQETPRQLREKIMQSTVGFFRKE